MGFGKRTFAVQIGLLQENQAWSPDSRACRKLTHYRRGLLLDRRRHKDCDPPILPSRTGLPQLSLHTPLGALTFSEEDGAIVALDWGWGRDQSETMLLARARTQMHEYLDGERQQFELPTRLVGTVYQRKVWEALSSIPYGQTRSYAAIAGMAGGGARSVGQANRRNPVPILVPCHRAVGADGIGGYSGNEGLATKRYLLQLEAHSL